MAMKQLLIFLLTSCVVATVVFAAPPAQTDLKNAVIQSESKLNITEPWQKKIFSDEVVPLYQRFIRNYSQNTAGVSVDVDLDSIRQYLAFSGLKTLKRTEAKLLVYLRAEPGCTKCSDAAVVVRKLVKEKLERRGFALVWLSSDELNPKAAGQALDEKVRAIATQKKLAGALIVQMRLMPVDDQDTAYADEKKYETRLSFVAWEADELKEYKYDGRLEIMENDSLETAASRSLTEAFVDFGSKSVVQQIQDEGVDIQLSVSGFNGYEQYDKLRTNLRDKLKDIGTVDERRISRGKVTFSVRTKKTTEELGQLLTGLAVGPGVLSVADKDEHAIQLEVR
jgi:hypothetical protein